ncbi:MAG: YraN family protein [Candidatus Peribacteraceae bacterium]|nr:YraN family protein [Candidatus Peribacteraceae bacterium]MDD5741802.1 YraN family protein [Candidatus Peribacteraceae bacterium]
MTTNADTGLKGEEIAARYLLSIGYDIRGRNVRIGRDEIDILAHDPVDDVVVFAEVKTRSKLLKDFPPELGIDRRKKQRLILAARTWVNRHHYDRGYRMDLVSIAEGKVTGHLKELDWEE